MQANTSHTNGLTDGGSSFGGFDAFQRNYKLKHMLLDW